MLREIRAPAESQIDEGIKKEVFSNASKNNIKSSDVMSFRAIVPTQLIVSPIELNN